jgi:hypothetical protein
MKLAPKQQVSAFESASFIALVPARGSSIGLALILEIFLFV